jgi:hypothetical protein
VIKYDLLFEVNRLHNLRGKCWHLLNLDHISLLPKGEEACKVKEFRLHSVAKIVCKIMANILATCVHRMVSHSQSTFIKSRSTHNNFLYLKNTTRVLTCKEKTLPFFLKLDIVGDFCWNFV